MTPLRLLRHCAFAVGIVFVSCRDNGVVEPQPSIKLGEIVVPTSPLVLERGTRDTLSATTLDQDGDTVAVPVVWRSADDRIATFERGGILVALDTGITAIIATALGVASDPIGVRVVWRGPARIEKGDWTLQRAVSPGATVTDSVTVTVRNIDSVGVADAKVEFKVTEGGGSVSPTTATTDALGIASAAWTLGPLPGVNKVVATVVRDDGAPNPFVSNNAVTFEAKSYNAFIIERGDNQTGQILSDLSETPAVKLVDSLGAPRAGVPVVFTALSNGRVATAVVSTDANGVASPGTWTLGDIPGEQMLEAKAEDAKISLRAVATGTPIHYKPVQVEAGRFATCARESDGSVKCWGTSPQNGAGGNTNISTPTAVAGTLVAASLAGRSTHYCALTSTGSAHCWGLNARPDSTGANHSPNRPTVVLTDLTWSAIEGGFGHTCGIATDTKTYCWGDNGSGQLGDGTTTTRSTIRPVTGGFTFTKVSTGAAHTCALGSDGTAFCWGLNSSGQLGDATTTARSAPTAVAGGHSYQSLGAGETLTCGLSTAAVTYCWGTIAGKRETSPIEYEDGPTFVSISVGGTHACGLTGDGIGYCWGGNQFGQLGDSSNTNRAEPTKVAGDRRFSEISAGTHHTCARTTESAVMCWGRNAAGELGHDSSSIRTTPRYIVLGVNP